MPTILPPDLRAVMDALGVGPCPPPKSIARTEDSARLRAARTGISEQSFRNPGETEPRF